MIVRAMCFVNLPNSSKLVWFLFFVTNDFFFSPSICMYVINLLWHTLFFRYALYVFSTSIHPSYVLWYTQLLLKHLYLSTIPPWFDLDALYLVSFVHLTCISCWAPSDFLHFQLPDFLHDLYLIPFLKMVTIMSFFLTTSKNGSFFFFVNIFCSSWSLYFSMIFFSHTLSFILFIFINHQVHARRIYFFSCINIHLDLMNTDYLSIQVQTWWTLIRPQASTQLCV